MTMTQIRKAFKEEIKKNRNHFNPEIGEAMVEYHTDVLATIEEIWKEGFTTNYSIDFLKLANGFQINTGNYETCHVTDTYDLHCIKMDKQTVKEFAEYFLN